MTEKDWVNGNAYIFESLGRLILLKITSLCHFPRICRMVNGVKVLLSGHLERVLPALVHDGVDNDVVAAV